ncbi:MAG: substrate-binding domain-containing protein [Thermoplasmata archaeon]
MKTVTNEPADEGGEPAASFEAAASRAGLVLPPRRRLNLWVAIGIVVLLVGASIGVGELTGWAIGPRENRGSPGVYGAQQCQHVPSYLSVNLTASVSGHADPVLNRALASWGSDFSNWSGGCVHLDELASAGDGFVPDLAGAHVDVVATDALPNASDREALAASVTLVPEAAAAVSVIYDLPGVSSELRLDGPVLAGLFNGSITAWDDPAIRALNPTVDLAGAPPVEPVYRSDSAGVNAAFTGYLAEASGAWNLTVGVGDSVLWPTGTPANGATAMSNLLTETPGAIGYLEAGEALPANASVASLENPTGAFLLPTPANASAAVVARENSSFAKASDWTNLSLVNAPGPKSYPITEFVYFAVYHEMGSAYSDKFSQTNATWLLTFLWWLAGNGGANVTELGLGLLPNTFFGLDQVSLEGVTYNGGSLLENNEGGEGGETGEF